MRVLAALLLGLMLLSAWNAGEAGVVAVSIREWTVPWPHSQPRDPAVAADGRIWFVGQNGDYLAVLDPGGGEDGRGDFRRYDLPEGTGPHNVVIGPGGDLWVAGNRGGSIIRVSPDSGETTVHHIRGPDPDPHTQRFDPEGRLWFTLQHFNAIGHLDIESGKTGLIRLPMAHARPYGLDVAANGDLWFAEFGRNKLAKLRTGKIEIREFVMPRWNARPRRLAVAPDGGVWYVDYVGGYLGHLDPISVEFKEWPAPAGAGALPYAMALDDEGRPWFVQTGPDPNTLVGFDPRTHRYIARVPIPSGGGSVRNMTWDSARSSLWFGTDTNTIVQAEIE